MPWTILATYPSPRPSNSSHAILRGLELPEARAREIAERWNLDQRLDCGRTIYIAIPSTGYCA